MCTEGTFHRGNVFPTFRGTEEGQSFLFILVGSQVSVIQNNQYAKNGILGGGMFFSPLVVFKLAIGEKKREKEKDFFLFGRSRYNKENLKASPLVPGGTKTGYAHNLGSPLRDG